MSSLTVQAANPDEEKARFGSGVTEEEDDAELAELKKTALPKQPLVKNTPPPTTTTTEGLGGQAEEEEELKPVGQLPAPEQPLLLGSGEGATISPTKTEEQQQQQALPEEATPATAAATTTTTTPPPPEHAKASQYTLAQTEALKNQRDNHQWSYGGGIACLYIGDMINFNGTSIVPQSVTLTLIFRDAVLDLSRANFVHPITTIYVVAVGGRVRLTIPRGVRVEVGGLGVCGDFGGLHSGVDANNPSLDAPIIRLEGFSVCSNTLVEINYLVPELIIRGGGGGGVGGQGQEVQNV